MKNYFLPYIITVITVILFSSCSGKNDQQKATTDNDEWQSLFSSINDTVLWKSNRSEFFPAAGWAFENDELILSAGRKGGDLITRKQYTDFELDLEFKMTAQVNSGVKYFVNQMTNTSNDKTGWVGFEYQIIDDFSGDSIPAYEGVKGSTGALYLIYAPDASKKKLYPVGEWNSMRIVVSGKHIEHWLNDEQVVNINIDSDDFAARLAATKFINYVDYGKLPGGHILLQDHGNEIAFRNILIKDTSTEKQ